MPGGFCGRGSNNLFLVWTFWLAISSVWMSPAAACCQRHTAHTASFSAPPSLQLSTEPWTPVDDIQAAVAPLDVAVLVNNVGHRTGWKPYHEAPPESLSATIACGTLVQARLTHLLLPQLLARLSNHPQRRSAVVFVTAQCSLPNAGLAAPGYAENPITVPYLATYEASNAFGYYHAASLIKEYTPEHPRLDLLNITPGAVLTENTAHTLSGTPFAVSADAFVGTVMRFLGGNVANGSTCAHWGHALSAAFVGVAPWRKEPTLREVGDEGGMRDFADQVVWGGVGTLMEVDVRNFVARWGGAVREMAPAADE